MDDSRLISEALQYSARSSGYNLRHANNYLMMYAPDKRYKLFALCGACSWAYNEHGKIRYKGYEYEYQQTKTGYIVKPATW